MKLKLQIKNRMNQLSQLIATFLALFTMVMSPVALGAEAQKLSKLKVEGYLAQMGLNKQITLGEFYQKNKNLFPPRIQKQIEPLFTNYKNQMMPQFELVTSKGPQGTDVQTLRVSQNGELMNIQLFGEKEKFAKFQNTNLTEIDVIHFDDMFTRITQGDEKYRIQTAKAIKTTTSKIKKMTGYPELEASVWKKMSQTERAAYLVNLRLMWNDARRVLNELDKKTKKPTKTSLLDQQVEKWDALMSFLNQPAQAAGQAPQTKIAAGKTLATVTSEGGTTASISSDNCIVAGYVSRYSGGKCGADDRYLSYSDRVKNEIVYTANTKCTESHGSGSIACNPYVYGTPGGNPVCVSTKEASFQIATHANGPCDTVSPLGSSDNLVKEDLKNGNRYSDTNMSLSEEQLKQKYKDEQKNNPAYVENFINGMLQFNKKNNPIDFSKPLTDESIQAIKNIKDVFDKDIITARISCEKAAANKKNEKNFWGACDQLHRRHLFIANYIENGHPGCPDGQKTVNPDTLKCQCGKGQEALPGSSCSTVGTSPSNPPASVPAESNKPAAAACSEPPTSKDCQCPNGAAPTVSIKGEEGSHSEGAEVLTCSQAFGGAQPKSECGLGCQLLKGLKVALPFVIGGVAIYALYRLMKPKVPTLNSAADSCPNGSRLPCSQACAAPFVAQADSKCGCADCPPGQTLRDVSACTCSTSSSTESTQYTCWDGVTKVSDLTLCPAQNYTCWDGSKVTNVLNCPEKPNTTSVPIKVDK
jgi:hypothetical protein